MMINAKQMKRSKKMERVKRNFLMMMCGLFVLFLSAGVSAQDETPVSPGDEGMGNVTLNPGYVRGNVWLGDPARNTEPVSKAKITARGKDALGNDLISEISLGKDLGSYEMTLHVPDEVWKTGGTQEYKVSCVVYYSSSSYYFKYKDQVINVSYGNTTTLNFEQDPPGYIKGSVSVGCKEFKSAKLYVRLSSDGNFVQTNIYIGAEGTFCFPVQPNAGIKVWGLAYMTDGWVFDLDERFLDVSAGGETAVNWNLLPEPCGSSCTGDISGKIELVGLGDNVLHHHWTQVDGATYRSQNINAGNDYVFERLQCGDHKFWARSYLNRVLNSDGKYRYDDEFRHPHTNYKWPVTVENNEDIITDVSTRTAFVNGKITLEPRTVVTIPEDAALDSYVTGHGVKDSTDNGWSRDQLNITDGSYDLILSEGDWDIYYTKFHFKNAECELCDDESPRYLNAYVDIIDYTRASSKSAFDAPKDIPGLIAGQTVNNHDISYETGAVTLKYYVKGGGTLSKPYLTGSNIDKSKASIGIRAYGPEEAAEIGEVTMIGLPGEYAVIPRATASDGSIVTFGEQTIYIEAGVCRVLEIGAPEITIDEPSSYNICNAAPGETIRVSGTVTDENGVDEILLNGEVLDFPLTGNTDPDKPNEVSFTATMTLESGSNRMEISASNVLGKKASYTRSIQNYEAGVFTTGDTGEIKVDWLYDGGMYEGELGIFSLDGMEDLEPNSVDFIREAVRRALSGSEEGHIIISDRTEGAKFDGDLGEPKNWNNGDYADVKTFYMKPGDRFATVLVPNSTLQKLSENPATDDSDRRPLFSLASANPEHGMYTGQIADINGKGNAFIYEDLRFSHSDRDYNDFIFQIIGADVCMPLLDDLIDPDADWRDFEGVSQDLQEHVETTVLPDTFWISLTLEGQGDLVLYNEDGQMCAAGSEETEDGTQTLRLTDPEAGSYRVVLLATDEGAVSCAASLHQGDEVLAEVSKNFEITAHQVLRAEMSVSADRGEILLSDFETPVAADGTVLHYDFDGDGMIDDSDIERVSSRWNVTAEDEGYDPFYDLDDDGYIGILDIMPVVNSRSNP